MGGKNQLHVGCCQGRFIVMPGYLARCTFAYWLTLQKLSMMVINGLLNDNFLGRILFTGRSET